MSPRSSFSGSNSVRSAGRRGRPVGTRGVLFVHHVFQCLPEQSVVVGFESVDVLAVREPAFDADFEFVVATPERDGRVGREASNLIARLRFDRRQELVVGRVLGAGKHEILPDEQPFLVAQSVEPVALVVAAAPHANRVHVGLHGARQQVVVDLGRHVPIEGVGRNPVRAAGENRLAVHAEVKSFPVAVFVRLPNELDFTKPDSLRHRMGLSALHRHVEVVQRLVAVGGRPPQLRVVDGHRQFRFAVGVEAHRLAFDHPINHCRDGVLAGRRDREPDPNVEFDRPRLVALNRRYVLDSRRGVCDQPDIAPDADRREARPPVPTEVALGLPNEVPGGLVHGVAKRRHVVRMGRRTFGGVLDRRPKPDANLVLAGSQGVGDVELVPSKHVLGLADGFAVDGDARDGIEAVTLEGDSLVVEKLLVEGNGPAILPVGFADPLDVEFVVPFVRIVDQSYVQ